MMRDFANGSKPINLLEITDCEGRLSMSLHKFYKTIVTT